MAVVLAVRAALLPAALQQVEPVQIGTRLDVSSSALIGRFSKSTTARSAVRSRLEQLFLTFHLVMSPYRERLETSAEALLWLQPSASCWWCCYADTGPAALWCWLPSTMEMKMTMKMKMKAVWLFSKDPLESEQFEN